MQPFYIHYGNIIHNRNCYNLNLNILNKWNKNIIFLGYVMIPQKIYIFSYKIFILPQYSSINVFLYKRVAIIFTSVWLQRKRKKNELHNSLHTQNFNLNDKQKIKIKKFKSNIHTENNILFFLYTYSFVFDVISWHQTGGYIKSINYVRMVLIFPFFHSHFFTYSGIYGL